jgi:peptidase E/ribosomal protein S18 acetylase RimI-like enzyme
VSGKLVTIGGGGFSSEPDNPLLDELVVSLARTPRPGVLFLPTASGDDPAYVYRFQRNMKRFTRKLAVLRLSEAADPVAATRLILEHDIIYAGSGDTARAVSAWRELGLDRAIAEAVRRGAVYCGVSAGAAALFESALVRPVASLTAARHEALTGLGLLPGGFCAHFDSEPQRRMRLAGLVSIGMMPESWALEDGAALVFAADGSLERLVSSHPDARAFRVSRTSSAAREAEHEPEYLGGPDHSGTVIRRAARCDAAGIHAAHDRSIRTIASRDYSAEQILAWTCRGFDAVEASRLQDEIRHDPMWVIEVAGRILGYAHLKTPFDSAPNVYLQSLYLTPEAAGQGLARKLMRLVEREGVRRGAPAVVLHSSKTARGFYEKLGYELTGPLDYHMVSGVNLERWPMRKLLVSQA